ncbi:MAG: ATP-binding cassette domain-containing protein [Polyangiaceae bacterium]|nr:ATP-binding cassette domain-containing protein [Polyangiaceae bacterium]
MLSVERVYKSFQTPVLRGVTLQVKKGEILGLVGPPGSGKSVLLQVFAGLLRPDAGVVKVSGVELFDDQGRARLDLQYQMGMLFQNIALFDSLNVGENVAFPLQQAQEIDESRITAAVSRELKNVGLEGFEKRAVTSLSGGQKRRVGLARAAVTRPPLLLYDEPAAGLDPVTSSRTFGMLKEQQCRLGASMVVVSSDLQRLLPVADRVAMLYRGRLLRCLPVERFYADEHPAVRQFLSGGADGPL